MTTRGQRRQRQLAEGRIKVATSMLYARAERLGVRRDFVEEAVESGGLVAITVGSQEQVGKLAVYGGLVTFDGERWPRLAGDGVTSTWRVPNIRGFDITYGSFGGLIHPIDHRINGLDISTVWLRTADELPDRHPSFSPEGVEEHIVVTRQGFDKLLSIIGHTGLQDSLAYAERQIFETK